MVDYVDALFDKILGPPAPEKKKSPSKKASKSEAPKIIISNPLRHALSCGVKIANAFNIEALRIEAADGIIKTFACDGIDKTAFVYGTANNSEATFNEIFALNNLAALIPLFDNNDLEFGYDFEDYDYFNSNDEKWIKKRRLTNLIFQKAGFVARHPGYNYSYAPKAVLKADPGWDISILVSPNNLELFGTLKKEAARLKGTYDHVKFYFIIDGDAGFIQIGEEWGGHVIMPIGKCKTNDSICKAHWYVNSLLNIINAIKLLNIQNDIEVSLSRRTGLMKVSMTAISCGNDALDFVIIIPGRFD